MNYQYNDYRSHRKQILDISLEHKNSLILSSSPQWSFFSLISACSNLTKSAINSKIASTLAAHILQIYDYSTLNRSYMNKINFADYKEILRACKVLITEEHQIKLFSIILQSREHKNLKFAASNAMTVLNYSKYEFINKDLSSIEIEGADLSEALIINSNFQGSNLRKVDFSYANIYCSSFRNCDLTDAWFGQHPPIINESLDYKARFSWNGDYLAYSFNNAVLLHDIKHGITYKELKHNAEITEIAFSKDGLLLAISDKNSILHLWDSELNKKIGEFDEQKRTITSIAFSPDSNFIAVGSREHFLVIWNIKASQIKSLITLDVPVNSVTYSPCGIYIAIGVFDFYQLIVYAESPLINKFKFDLPEIPYNASFSPCSKYFINDCDDSTINVWDMENGQFIKTINWYFDCWTLFKLSFHYLAFSLNPVPPIKHFTKNGHLEAKWLSESLLNSLEFSFSPNEKYSAIKLKDKSIEIWDTKSLESHISEYKAITSISVSYDGKYIALTNNSKSIKIQIIEIKGSQFKLRGHQHIVTFATFSKHGYFLVSLCRRNTIIFWDVFHQDVLKRYSVGLNLLTALDISFDGNLIGVGHHSGDIKVWSIMPMSDGTESIICKKEGQKPETLNNFSSLENEYSLTQSGCVTCIKFSPCGHFIAAASINKKIILWEIDSKTSLELNGHQGNITCMCFIQCKNYLVSADANGLAMIWDISNTQDKIMEIHILDQIIVSLAVSCCGNYLAAGGIHGSIKLYDFQHKKMLKEAISHSKAVNSIQFFNNKTPILVTASMDATLKFFKINK
ncbi:unnamed protein product [Blepharisma stoltei]|uniref:Uncharacterized protein n=1 Tax=Blepharisma stoltei TaxID=1481888 RepID=A0AAU9JX66_9CILI|nr:unnamed protein product [Blepharisma stoltei]